MSAGHVSESTAPSPGSRGEVMWGEHAQEASGHKRHPQAEDFKGRACMLHAAAQIHLHSIYTPPPPPPPPPQLLRQQQFVALYVGQMAQTKVANCLRHHLFICSVYVPHAGGFKSLCFLPYGCCVTIPRRFAVGLRRMTISLQLPQEYHPTSCQSRAVSQPNVCRHVCGTLNQLSGFRA